MQPFEILMNNHEYQPDYAYKEGWGNPVEDCDVDFLNQICDYFQYRMSLEHVSNGSNDSSTWGPLIQLHQPIINALMNRDILFLHENLRNLCKTALTIGICGGAVLEAAYKADDEARKKFVFGVFDKLVSVAEASGIAKCYNPEDPTFANIMYSEPELFLNALSERYQFDISAPKYAGGNLGIETNLGIYSQRDMFGLHLALMIVDRFPDRNMSICDIGGGVGHLIYYLYRLGYRNLTIVDLPTISVSQMYFLGTNLPKDHGVKFLSPDQFTGEYDIVTNSDSFIEMSRSSAKRYLNLIQKNGKYLISVNQETGPSQFEDGFRVCDITDMRRVSRHMSWVRKGWVYEEYVSNNVLKKPS